MITFESRTRLILLLCILTALPEVLSAQTTNELPGRTIVKLLPDYARPRVYALNSGALSGGTGSVVALNASNGAFLAEVTLGTIPTDSLETSMFSSAGERRSGAPAML